MALTDEELAEIRSGCVDDQDAVVVLLAEVERLRMEGDLVTAMREYTTKLKRLAAWTAFSLVIGITAWNISSRLLNAPWSFAVAWLSGAVIGGVAGASAAWIEGKREADDA